MKIWVNKHQVKQGNNGPVVVNLLQAWQRLTHTFHLIPQFPTFASSVGVVTPGTALLPLHACVINIFTPNVLCVRLTVFLAAAVNHFNAHSVAAMMGYRHFPPALPDELRNATVCPPTYLPNMTMLDHSPPPSPAVLLHMMSSHLAWLSDEVANLPVSSYDANQEARAGRLALADLAFRRQLAT